MHAHHQHLVEALQERFNAIERRARSQRGTYLDLETQRLGDHVVRCVGRLDVEDERVPAGFRKSRGVLRRMLDHQVNVERQRGAAADGLDKGRSEGDVRNEMPVHYVEVEGVRPRGFRRTDRARQVGEVGREERGRERSVRATVTGLEV